MIDVMQTELSFLTREPISGESLAIRLAEGALPPADALRYALEIGAILQQAHGTGVVHGGLTPERVLIAAEGARVLEPLPDPIVTRYTAPELLAGIPADARADIFSFGTLLYEMISGWPAFPGDDDVTLRIALLQKDPPPVSTLLGGSIRAASPAHLHALDKVLAGCMTRDPDRRRQRIQNALIELRLVARPLSKPLVGSPAAGIQLRRRPLMAPPVLRGPLAAPSPLPASDLANVPPLATFAAAVEPEPVAPLPVATAAVEPAPLAPPAAPPMLVFEPRTQKQSAPKVEPEAPMPAREPQPEAQSVPEAVAEPQEPATVMQVSVLEPRPEVQSVPEVEPEAPVLAVEPEPQGLPTEPSEPAPVIPFPSPEPPAPPAGFQNPLPEPVALHATPAPFLPEPIALQKARIGRLLVKMAPTLDDDFVRAAEDICGTPAVEAEDALSPQRGRPVEPAPRPATLAPTPYSPGQITYSRGSRRRYALFALGVLLLMATIFGAVAYVMRRPQPPVVKFALTPPEHTSYPGNPAVSPNGNFIAFSALGPEGRRMLWLRPLDALHPAPIAGTENAFAPFWSPDSEYIAFFADNALKKVRISGGAPEVVCAAESNAGGGAWNRDGVILFAPGLVGGLMRVSANGGSPVPVTVLNEKQRERGHLWPRFLPDNKHFTFYAFTDFEATTGIYIGALDSTSTTRLLASETNAIYSSATATDASRGVSSQGYLLYVRNGSLYAQSFNASSLELAGDAIFLVENIGAVRSMGLAPISVSDNGVFVYQMVKDPTRQLQWFDRSGRQLASAAEPGEWGPPRIAPDGKRAMAGKKVPGSGAADLWIVGFDGTLTQWTNTVKDKGAPVWSPDGTRLAFFGTDLGPYDIYERTIDGGRPEVIVRSDDVKIPNDWSADGKWLLFGVIAATTKSDLWALHLPDRKPYPILKTVYGEGFGVFSPDGKWIAFQSDQPGYNEVYVQAFHPENGGGTERRFQISVRGGGLPRWRKDGREIFYMTIGGSVMAADVRIENGEVISGKPHVLFNTRVIPKTWNLYDVSPDGQHFLINSPLEGSSDATITVMTNWTEKLKTI